jgi:hypothetical protein
LRLRKGWKTEIKTRLEKNKFKANQIYNPQLVDAMKKKEKLSTYILGRRLSGLQFWTPDA